MDFEKQLRDEFQRESESMQPSNKLNKRVSASFEEYRQTKQIYKSVIKRRLLMGLTAVTCFGAIFIFNTSMPSYANISTLQSILNQY